MAQQQFDPAGRFLLEKFESVPEYANYLLTCGKQLFHQEQYEGALQAFMHSVSVLEQPGQTFDADELEWRGAMLHNMASCLHHLAELDRPIGRQVRDPRASHACEPGRALERGWCLSQRCSWGDLRGAAR